MNQYGQKPRFRLTVRAAMHLVPGLLFITVAVILLKTRHFGTIDLGTSGAAALACLLVVYGIFRIWRGFKEMQPSEDDEA